MYFRFNLLLAVVFSLSELISFCISDPVLYARLENPRAYEHEEILLPGIARRLSEVEKWWRPEASNALATRDQKQPMSLAAQKALKDRDYKIIGSLGSGGFCQVYHVSERGQDYAAKLATDGEGIDSLKEEAKIYADIGPHKSILGYKGSIPYTAILLDKRTRKMYKKDAAIMIIEYCRFLDSEKVLEAYKVPTVSKVLTMLRITAGLIHAKSKDYHHLDIKPVNILVAEPQKGDKTRDGEVKIADFGIALKGKEAKVKAGTPGYMAPEVLTQPNRKQDLEKVDVFALGATFFYILYEKAAFKSSEEVVNGVAARSWRRYINKPEAPAERWERLFTRMLHPSQRERADLREVQQRLLQIQNMMIK